jgi:EmrB/QacA subfamily drug resistance transporter
MRQAEDIRSEIPVPHRTIVLIVSTAAAFLTPFMSSALNVALPSIGREFAMNAVLLGWVATSFILAAAVFLVPFGKFADIHGRKKIFAWGSLAYALTSVLSALAPSPGLLLASRVLQGIGGAMIFSTGVAMLTSAYPVSERGKVLGLNVSSTYLGLSLGPVLGGILTQNLGWRSIFWINGALGLVVFGLVLAYLPEEWAEARGEKFDAAGSLLLGSTLIAVMLGLSRLPKPIGGILILAGLIAAVFFVRWEMRSSNPVLNMNLFRQNTVFAFSNLAALINYCATFAVGFLVSLYLQYCKGLSPQKAGLVLIAQPVMMAVFSPLTGRLSDRIEPRLLASAGMAVSVLGLLLLSFLGPATGLGFIFAALLVLGFGFALFSSPNTNAVMSSVERRFYGVASATLGTMRMTGQMLSMGTAMLIFALFLGASRITPDVFPQFLTAVRTAFWFFAALCLGGVFASLSRGKLR